MNVTKLGSGLLYLYCIAHAALHDGALHALAVAIGLILAVIAVWMPDMVNFYTVGLWINGYRIDNPTPTFLIALGGWGVLVWAFVRVTWPHVIDTFLLSLLN